MRGKSSNFVARVMFAFPLLATLGACLPSAGPGSSAFSTRAYPEGAYASTQGHDVVALNAEQAEWISSYGSRLPSPAPAWSQSAAPRITLGVGDVVDVTIFEAAPGGLFSSASDAVGGTKSVTLPSQAIAADGTITVPYVEKVAAAGRTPAAVETEIEAALGDKAIQPQVIVTVARPASSLVTVVGDVAHPGQLPLSLGGNHLVDIVAAAGGSKAPAYDTFVRLTRGRSSLTENLATMVQDANRNVFLRPGDEVYVFTDPQVYTVFGAVLQSGSFPFGADRLTLAQAVGRAGGLNDNRANPTGVFLFRTETPEIYAYLHPVVRASSRTDTRVIYQFNLNSPDGYFAAQRFAMRDNDIVYVTNAASTSLQKLFSVVNGGAGTASTTTRVLSTAIPN